MKFIHTAKWHTYKPEYAQENEIHKILWEFEIQTYYLNPARRPSLIMINQKNQIKIKKTKQKKKTCDIMGVSLSADPTVKINESEKRDKYLDLAREPEKTVEHEGGGDTNFNWRTWNGPQRLFQVDGSVVNRSLNRDHPNSRAL